MDAPLSRNLLISIMPREMVNRVNLSGKDDEVGDHKNTGLSSEMMRIR